MKKDDKAKMGYLVHVAPNDFNGIKELRRELRHWMRKIVYPDKKFPRETMFGVDVAIKFMETMHAKGGTIKVEGVTKGEVYEMKLTMKAKRVEKYDLPNDIERKLPGVCDLKVAEYKNTGDTTLMVLKSQRLNLGDADKIIEERKQRRRKSGKD